MDRIIFDNRLGSYLLLFLFLLITSCIFLFLYIYFQNKPKSRIKLFLTPFIFLLYSISFNISLPSFTKYTQVYNLVKHSTKILYVFTFTLLIIKISYLLIEKINRNQDIKERIHLTDQIILLFKRTILLTSIFISSMIILSFLGVNILSLVAGFGILSGAIALASQEFLTNIIGGITIFFSKDINVGDLVDIDGETGYVSNIGLRVTTLKRFDNKTVIIPNGKVVKSTIINHTDVNSNKISYTIQLEYKTPVEKIKKAIEIITGILNGCDQVKDKNSINVGFYKFDKYSLNLYVNFSIDKNSDMGEVKEYFNYLLKYNFDKEGLNFAFPTQTIELKNKE